MRAVRMVDAGQLEVAEVPEPGDRSRVLVRPSIVGICGTDVKILGGKIPVTFPRILGHEMVGEVVGTPPDSGLVVGDRVLADPAISCQECEMCRVGRTNICLRGGLLGRDQDGVFADLLTLDEAKLVRIPGSVTDDAAGLVQVLGTCVHAIGFLEVKPGRVAAVVGLGVGGQLIAQLLTLAGMRVVGVTRSGWKRRLAEESGVIATAPPDRAGEVLDEITSGAGPEIVVEAVGKEETLSKVISLAATGGQVLVFGTLTGAGEGLPYYQLYHKELTVFNPRAAVIGDYIEAVRLAGSGELRLEPLVTDRFSLDDAKDAFARVGEPDSLKVLMTV
jgi:2-desacetyl-2-hydroxyethyl bacteriochlorophyllide A dehydrogenase